MHAFNPEIGKVYDLGNAIRRITAPNPSPMTFRGTNTYLVGQAHVAVIDPGPDHDDHLDAILAATQGGAQITHIFVTHAHQDHSPLAARLSVKTNAPVYAFGRAKDGQSALMRQLEHSGYDGGGEGIDQAFAPDIRLADGETVTTPDWAITAHHTPGHMANHMCFALGAHLFSGDHVMGWATSMVSPPDGDLADFLAACRRLTTTPWQTFYPGHGDIVTAPNERLQWLIDHRLQRGAQITAALDHGPQTARDIAKQVYRDIDPSLIPAATRNVFAHLLDLYSKGLITFEKPLTGDSVFYPDPPR